MTFTSFISNKFPSLNKTLGNSLSNTDRELLFESIKRYNESVVKEAIAEYNSIDFTGGE